MIWHVDSLTHGSIPTSPSPRKDAPGDAIHVKQPNATYGIVKVFTFLCVVVTSPTDGVDSDLGPY